MNRAVLFLGLGALTVSLFGSGDLAAQSQFPHDRHSLFFADCSVCHGGLSGGAEASPFPEASFCSACHDGATAPSIDWQPQERRSSNLNFDHARHELDCSFCHLPSGVEDLTQLQMPAPATCLGCHDPQAQEHLASDQCSFCHVPVVETNLDADRIAGFPAPPTHQAPDFGISHGATAREAGATCATCHDRTSCTTCHGGATHVPRAVLDLPAPRADGPTGVSIPSGAGGAGFHPADFGRSHAVPASTGQMNCTTCHEENTCTQCHDGFGSPPFHPLNFMASHGAEAFGRVSDCKSCHNSEGFCRECHLGSGIQGGNGLVAPFHDGQALWILSHPQAARQDLESCVTCHQQKDCLRCHSATTGMGVSPHGPGFDAASMQDRNQAMCKLCHVRGFLGGGN